MSETERATHVTDVAAIRGRDAEWNDDHNPLHHVPSDRSPLIDHHHRAAQACYAEAISDRRALLAHIDALAAAARAVLHAEDAIGENPTDDAAMALDRALHGLRKAAEHPTVVPHDALTASGS